MLEPVRRLSTDTVTSTDDPPALTSGTLRWAIRQAHAATTDSTIDFNLGPDPATIWLIQASLQVQIMASAAITINGPGAGLLSIDANEQHTVIFTDTGTTSTSGLTISGGLVDRHGCGHLQESGVYAYCR